MAQFSQIKPYFISLGKPDLINDKKGFKITDTFSLAKFININLEYEYFRNNLANQLASTLKTDIFTTNMNLSVHKNLPAIRIYYQTYHRENDKPTQLTGAINDRISSFNLSSIYQFRLFENSFAQVSYSQTRRKDKINPINNNKNINFSLDLNLKLNQVCDIKFGTKFINEKNFAKNQSVMFFFGTDYLFLSNRLRAGFDCNLTSSKDKSNKVSINLGMMWNLDINQSIEADIGWVDFNDNEQNNDYIEKYLKLKFIQII